MKGWHDDDEDLTHGTSHAVVKPLIRAVGVKPRRIDSLSLLGRFKDPHGDIEIRTYNNPFVGFALHLPEQPLHLTELILHDFCLSEVSDAMLGSFSLPSLRTLRFVQCVSLPVFLVYLMDLREQIRIHNLELCTYNREEWLYKEDETNLARFCEAFTTLRTIIIQVCFPWRDLFEINCLRLHTQVETAVFGFGDQKWPFERATKMVGNFRTLRSQHPNMRSISFRWDEFYRDLSLVKWTKSGKQTLKVYAAEIVQFEKLEQVKTMCPRPDNLAYETCEIFVRHIRDYLVEASAGECKINTIG